MAKKKHQPGAKHTKSPVSYHSNDPAWMSYLPAAAFIAAGLLVFFPAFFRGLFFNREMFIMQMVTALVLLLVGAVQWRRRDISFLHHPLDYVALLFAVAYLISVPGAVHYGEAFYGFLRILTYLAIYWIVSRSLRDWADMEWLARILMLAGLGVGLIGLLVALGWPIYDSAWNGREIRSTLQYQNGGAAFMAFTGMVVLGMWTREKDSLLQLAYLMCGSLLTLILLGSMSKGAWLMYGLIALVLIIGMPRGYRLKALFGLMVTGAAAAGAFVKVFPMLMEEKSGASLWLLPGLAAVIAGWTVWQGIVYLYQVKSGRTVTLSLTALVVAALIPVAWIGRAVWMSPRFMKEFSGLFDLSNKSFSSRLTFMEWGWQMVKDYPIAGTGVRGWEALYHRYQDGLFWTNEVHNQFLNVWIETGTIGFICWMALLAAAVWYVYRLKQRTDRRSWMLIWGAACGCLVLVAHSLIDFDLSIPALSILLWTGLGMLAWAHQQADSGWGEFKLSGLVDWIAIILVSGTLLITGFMFTIGERSAQQGVDSLKKFSAANEAEQLLWQEKALQSLGRAVAWDPFNAQYRAEWAYINASSYVTYMQADPAAAKEYYRTAGEALQAAADLKPYDIHIRQRLAETAALLGDAASMREQAEGAIQANPMDIEAYHMLAMVLWQGYQYYDQSGQGESAREFAAELVHLPDRVQKQKQQIDPDHPWRGDKLELSEKTMIQINEASQWLNE